MSIELFFKLRFSFLFPSRLIHICIIFQRNFSLVIWRLGVFLLLLFLWFNFCFFSWWKKASLSHSLKDQIQMQQFSRLSPNSSGLSDTDQHLTLQRPWYGLRKTRSTKELGTPELQPQISFDVLNWSLPPPPQLWELAPARYLLMCTDTKLVITPWESLERGWHQATSSRWENNFQVEHGPSGASSRWAGGGFFFFSGSYGFLLQYFFSVFSNQFFHLLQPILNNKQNPLILFGLTVWALGCRILKHLLAFIQRFYLYYSFHSICIFVSMLNVGLSKKNTLQNTFLKIS